MVPVRRRKPVAVTLILRAVLCGFFVVELGLFNICLPRSVADCSVRQVSQVFDFKGF
jgi:hypothetical protein